MGKEVRVVFCDIRKTFDSVWHAGLLHKLKAAAVQGELLKWFTNYLAERNQRVILPGVASDWTYILTGVPQGSILGLILFLYLIYINDISLKLAPTFACSLTILAYALLLKILLHLLFVLTQTFQKFLSVQTTS